MSRIRKDRGIHELFHMNFHKCLIKELYSLVDMSALLNIRNGIEMNDFVELREELNLELKKK